MDISLRIGIDIGSTTIKIVGIDEGGKLLFSSYRRHYSEVYKTLRESFISLREQLNTNKFAIMVTGSAGIGVAERLGLPFVQEVIACTAAVSYYIPETDTAIELGGEDAKITYFGESPEQRMNGVCAGGTGAFIDHMAALLETDAEGLEKLAEAHQRIYPIAARCGVFAKTDIQALINDGIGKEDIAASVLQAVANQVVGNLAMGRPISGKIAFLGGPLHFLPELRARFKETLHLTPDRVVELSNACYFVALGSALKCKAEDFDYDFLMQTLEKLSEQHHHIENSELCLFADENEYREFKERHAEARIARGRLADYEGRAYLGIDAGSTTTKLALIGESGELLYSFYNSNRGMALKTVVDALRGLYAKLNDKTVLCCAGVTGYGEYIVKAALNVDIGEVETVAHLRAAQAFCPEVDFVLDIGGQDMKSFYVHDGVIDNIMLNEACSSGCGSFIENFAQGLRLKVEEFASLGVMAKHPVDLGTRCTVFMNSRVKQAQKEGAAVGDISAGIAISVIKNALFKVIQLKNIDALGKNIVVQGGTFYNDAVLRALEHILQRPVIRPDIAGLMGAYGMALVAKEEGGKKTQLLSADKLESFNVQTTNYRCQGCENHCLVTLHKFSNGKSYATGNHCERGVGKVKTESKVPNAYKFKNERLFSYKPLENAPRGQIGVPRVLNLYEDYPFWFTFLTTLGFEVVLSGKSSLSLFQKGLENIPSDSLCFPAKLTYGHIADLVERGIKRIFYPCLPYNPREEDLPTDNTFNCPIVASYPEDIRVNMDILQERGITFIQPFLPASNIKRLRERLLEEFSFAGVTKSEVGHALELAEAEQGKYQQDIRDYGTSVAEQLEREGLSGIVLAGRPYHVDHLINHGIDELIQSYGLAVLSEDMLCHLSKDHPQLHAINQWSFHARLYQTASYVCTNPQLSLIQLSSFGCGLDAITIPQVKQIIEQCGQIYTMIKLDEVTGLGAVKIRLRSLQAALKRRRQNDIKPLPERERAHLTPEKSGRDIILAPQLAPIQFPFIVEALRKYGYDVVIPSLSGKPAVDLGLRYVSQDICYPAVIVIGQMLEALKSGKYPLDRTSVMFFQSGGACRATNYLQLMREALKHCGLEQIPVFACWGTEHDAFKLSFPCYMDIAKSIIYGDLLMRVSQRVRPYEKVVGCTEALFNKWAEICKQEIHKGSYSKFKENIHNLVKEFEALPIFEELQKPKVGVVGEILVKYHPLANNNLVKVLEKEGAEVVLPDLLDFVFYMAYDDKAKYEILDGSFADCLRSRIFMKSLDAYRRPMQEALASSKRFLPIINIDKLAKLTEEHLSLANMAGEGWLLTGEMLKYVKEGIENIVCLQPFGCLPNQVTGKGMVREVLRAHPGANIVTLDCDAGASEVNQLNRLKLMLTIAKEKLGLE